MSIIRAVTNQFVLSAYHGSETQRALAAVDLGRAVTRDLRPEVAEAIAGRPVWHPESNPGPPACSFRTGLAKPQRFFQELTHLGVGQTE
ncbi:MAG: hypothetical protein ACQESR_16750 [Planctomycetota bacterium]